LPDEEFDMLGEDELALLTRRFERMHENRVNSRRNTRTCFQCGKPGHFFVDCPEKVENKDNYKHKSKMDFKYHSRCDQKHKHKGKHKDERRSRKKESRGKARVKVGASNVDSSSAYSTSSSSSSEDEGDQRKGMKPPKNLSGLSCFAKDDFCTMALSSGSKKSNQSDSDSDFDDEVRDELPFLRQENEWLGLLLDNRDDMLREAKKMRKELRASLEHARTRVAELETQNLDAKLEIDSLKASPVVFDEDEGDRHKSRKSSKNLSGLSCFARDGFCTMVLSSGRKKSTQSDSHSDSDDEVRDELPFLRQENERLGLLLDNRDDMLREAKKMRKELRALLEGSRTRVAELETLNLDAKLEIDSLKASPVVSDEVECANCPIFLADLAMFKEKHASKCEELDVLRVEGAEFKSRPALLGPCTSCPVLHEKNDEIHAYTVSLEAKLILLIRDELPFLR
jgi:hypothetical protein